MAYKVLIHFINADPLLAEIERIPEPQDQVLICSNVRLRDGKEVHYIDPEAVQVIIPWHRISFVEVLSAREEAEIISFVRER
ncbi:MAG: hypothetical protein J7452_04000 [Thermoflexus sp.]|jgi:hypothetical protein|nr:hypothetical protein [Thermoflexus sp.]